VEEVIDNLLELRGPDVLRQIERRTEMVSFGADQLAHDAGVGIGSGSGSGRSLAVHPIRRNSAQLRGLLLNIISGGTKKDGLDYANAAKKPAATS
jgi:hypothetical protein